MHPFGLLLMILLAAAVTGEVHGAHPAADTPAGRFWEEALDGAPLPEAIADLVQEGIDHSPLKVKGSYTAAYAVLSRLLGTYQGDWDSNFTLGTPPRGFFFREEDVARVGSVTSVYFPPATTTPILPRDVVEKLAPFGSLQDTLAMFDMTPGSAEVVAETLRRCQDTSLIYGERKACATSLEGTVRAAALMLQGATGLWAVASAVPRAGLPRQRYVVTEVTQLPGDHHVACHDQAFPYAVFHCHMLAQPSRAYMITIRGFDGRPGMVMAAMCHLDTSDWNPTHPAFQMLGTQPGGAPVCHFLHYANLLFGKRMMEDTT